MSSLYLMRWKLTKIGRISRRFHFPTTLFWDPFFKNWQEFSYLQQCRCTKISGRWCDRRPRRIFSSASNTAPIGNTENQKCRKRNPKLKNLENFTIHSAMRMQRFKIFSSNISKLYILFLCALFGHNFAFDIFDFL